MRSVSLGIGRSDAAAGGTGAPLSPPHQVAESVRFRVTLDGAVLGNSHGMDVDADAGVL